MLRLLAPCTFRFREKASVFLTELHPAPDTEARREVLGRLRKRDFDATHHCAAWREGLPCTSQGSDDDGEPSGTAGAPMLRVLEGADLSDVLAVCIRWFGGTKLGGGGLVRAYTAGVQGALQVARMEGLLQDVRPLRRGTITVATGQAHLPYALLGAFPDVEILGQDCDAREAKLYFQLPPERTLGLERAWNERSRGGLIEWGK